MTAPMSRRQSLAALIGFGLAGPGLAQELIETRPSALHGGLHLRPRRRPIPRPEALIARSGLQGQVGFALADMSGQVIEADPRAAAAPPASTLKAITAIYALERLGTARRFRTRVIRSGDMLILAGGGDPLLDTDGLAQLARDLAASGQTSPARFAVWGGALPSISELAPEQDDHLAYNPSISGMILNFNRVHLDWRRAGGDWQMSLQARAARRSPRAYTVTASAAAQAPLFTYRLEERLEHWTVSRAALGNGGSRWLPVRRPELYAGDVFQTLCRAEGLVLPAPEVIEYLPAGQEVAHRNSPPLRDILRGMLDHSTNLTAEIVGLHASGAADLARSGAAMQGWLAERGMGQGFVLADHSGLSAASRVTPAGMARLMALAPPDLAELLNRDPLSEDLPAGSVTQPYLRAKTGTLNFVSNLAGYIDGPGGQRLAFALICTDPPRRAASQGQELPAGVRGWTRQAKALQHEITAAWRARYG